MKIIYRPEIDGLRAIAVLAVIFYHANISLFGHSPFKGGFIGVDIFFVISGYLITSIIFKEVLLTNNFSFTNFYKRRIRRIIPALLFVILLSLPFGWIYLIPSSFIDFSKSILFSLGFSSNFYFYFTGQEYGAENGLIKPFLHTWSLSVEEQFYIIFPIIFLILFKNFKKYLGIILLILFCTSLFLSDIYSKSNASIAFYFLQTRVWELLAGSLLAYCEGIGLKKKKIPRIFNILLTNVGILLIILSIVFLKIPYFPHPSFYTLPAVIGVCLVIWFSQKDELTCRILSSKPFVGIGLISYSLYLFHYPIFAFARINDSFSSGDIYEKCFLFVILFLLSIFSYLFIERPARNKNYDFKFILFPILASITIFIFLNIYIIKENGFKDRVPEILKNVVLNNPVEQLKNSNNEICFDNMDQCTFNSSANQKVFIVGDSEMAAITADLKDKLIKKNFGFVVSTVGACLFFPEFETLDTLNNKKHKKCTNDYFLKQINNFDQNLNSILIFGGRFPLYIENQYFNNKEGGIEGGKWEYKLTPIGRYKTIQSSFKNSISKLEKYHKIILIYPIPEVGFNVTKKIFNQYPKNFFFTKKKNELNYLTTSYEVYKERTASTFDLLDSIKGQNIFRVYPHKLFCNTLINKRCITHDELSVFYSDDNHLSNEGAKLLNNLILTEINKIQDN